MRFDNSIYVPVIEVLKGLGGRWSTLWATDENGWVNSQDIFVLGGYTFEYYVYSTGFSLQGEEEGEKLLAELTLHLTLEVVDPEWVDANKVAARRSRRCLHKRLRRALRG